MVHLTQCRNEIQLKYIILNLKWMAFFIERTNKRNVNLFRRVKYIWTMFYFESVDAQHWHKILNGGLHRDSFICVSWEFCDCDFQINSIKMYDKIIIEYHLMDTVENWEKGFHSLHSRGKKMFTTEWKKMCS